MKLIVLTLHLFSVYLDFKLDTNTQSIIEKILEEQLKQSATIDTLQDEISEIRKLLENIKNVLTTLASGSLTIMTEKQPRQRLRRKDTKHMWWDVSIMA